MVLLLGGTQLLKCSDPRRELKKLNQSCSRVSCRTPALALVYAPAEYCITRSRSRHTSLLDVSLNCNLCTITGCLQPTPVEQLPVLACIPPAELHKQAASTAIAHRVMDPDHLLHQAIAKELTQPRLKSRHPFAWSGKELLSIIQPTREKSPLDI